MPVSDAHLFIIPFSLLTSYIPITITFSHFISRQSPPLHSRAHVHATANNLDRIIEFIVMVFVFVVGLIDLISFAFRFFIF